MNELLGTIFLFIALGTLMYILALLFLHLYQIFEEPNIEKKMRKLRKQVQPWVTVLVYSRSDEDDIDASLKALLRSYYHNFDIVVIKDYSRDAKRALEKGYKNSQKGRLVISLRAGAIVPRSFIKRAVAMKGERQRFALRIHNPVSSYSLSGILRTLDAFFWQNSYKAQVSDTKNVVVPKRTQHFSMFSILIFIVIIAACVVISDSVILWYSWLIATSYLLAIIWLGEEKVTFKLQLSFSAFSALFLLPVASFVVRLSQFRTRN